MPKIWTVAGMMLKSPQTALYWGSYLMKICADTKSLCMQFESVVTNSSLTFADIQFLEINQEIAAILKLSEIGNVDWQQLLDDIASVPGNFTVENLPRRHRDALQYGSIVGDGRYQRGIRRTLAAECLQRPFQWQGE